MFCLHLKETRDHFPRIFTFQHANRTPLSPLEIGQKHSEQVTQRFLVFKNARRAQAQKLRRITRMRGAPVALGPVGPTGDPTPAPARHSFTQTCRAPFNGSNASKSLLKATPSSLKSLPPFFKIFLLPPLRFFKNCSVMQKG